METHFLQRIFFTKNNLQEEQHKFHLFEQQRKTVPHGILEDIGMQRYTWKLPKNSEINEIHLEINENHQEIDENHRKINETK